MTKRENEAREVAARLTCAEREVTLLEMALRELRRAEGAYKALMRKAVIGCMVGMLNELADEMPQSFQRLGGQEEITKVWVPWRRTRGHWAHEGQRMTASDVERVAQEHAEKVRGLLPKLWERYRVYRREGNRQAERIARRLCSIVVAPAILTLALAVPRPDPVWIGAVKRTNGTGPAVETTETWDPPEPLEHPDLRDGTVWSNCASLENRPGHDPPPQQPGAALLACAAHAGRDLDDPDARLETAQLRRPGTGRKKQTGQER